MFLQKLKVDAGFPSPLGATVFEAGVNFSIYSHHAEKIVLCFFNRFGYETHHIPMNRTEDIWHVFVRDIHAGQLYGYRVYGPYDPQNGHLFNGHKLLLDPAAKQLTGPVLFHETQLPYIVGHKKREFSFSRLDSAPFMPKCIVTDENAYRVFKSTKPFIPYEKTIIYETHVKGFTIKKEDIPRRVRGTFAGLAHPKTVAYLKNLGITSVELLPIAAFNTPEHLLDLRLTNYWGYDPICFMAPQSTYLSTEKLVEIKNMVQAYHEAGIEVLLDVVYNHTGEGGYMGPLLSYRGIDNASYYRLMPDEPRYYMDDTGCGNTFNLAHPAALQITVQALRYWAEIFDIDGFRFDLAVTLGRNGENTYTPDAAFFKVLQKDAVLSKVKLIAEPWDLGPNGYQLGNFPPFFSEWDGQFRDTTRQFWKGDMGQAGAMLHQMTKPLTGSRKGKHQVLKKVNFITAHDGFTLYDLVSYNNKHNDANKEQNRDGSNANFSWNSGTEGHTNNPTVMAFRLRRMRAMLATLFLSNGIPMLLGGDEMLRSQYGNNNAYCQDNKISWLHWKTTQKARADMYAFVERLIHFRRDHPDLMALLIQAPEHFQEGLITALKPDGTPMSETDWQAFVRCFSIYLKDEKNKTFYNIILNAADVSIDYKTPAHDEKIKWKLMFETSETIDKLSVRRGHFEVPAWCVMVLKGTL